MCLLVLFGNPHPNVRFWLLADLLPSRDLGLLYPRKRTYLPLVFLPTLYEPAWVKDIISGKTDKRKSPSDCSSGPSPAQNLLKSLRTLGNFELENSSKLACQFFPEFQNDLTNPPGGLELIFNPHLAIFLWNMGIRGRCSLGYAIDVVGSENLNSMPSKDVADTA